MNRNQDQQQNPGDDRPEAVAAADDHQGDDHADEHIDAEVNANNAEED